MVTVYLPPPKWSSIEKYFVKVGFSMLEVIFCVFLAENNFVNALVQFIGVRECQKTGRPYEGRNKQQGGLL